MHLQQQNAHVPLIEEGEEEEEGTQDPIRAGGEWPDCGRGN